MAKTNCGTCNSLGYHQQMGYPNQEGVIYVDLGPDFTPPVAQTCNPGCECQHQPQGVYMPDGTFLPTAGLSVNYGGDSPLFQDIYGALGPAYAGGPSAFTNPDNPYTYEEFLANSVSNSYTCHQEKGSTKQR